MPGFAGLGVFFFALMFSPPCWAWSPAYLGVTGFEWSFEWPDDFVCHVLGVLVAELRGDNLAFAALRAILRPTPPGPRFFRGALPLALAWHCSRGPAGGRHPGLVPIAGPALRAAGLRQPPDLRRRPRREYVPALAAVRPVRSRA